MTERFAQPPGATPLGPDDIAGLIPHWITFQNDLNQAEGDNIQRATVWANTRAWRTDQLLQEIALKDLHARMFGDVWTWAGTYRQRDTNLGVRPFEIAAALRDALDDTTLWVETKDPARLPIDEIAVRFHHRLVAVHPFPNGNGRHARLAADILVVALGGRRFSWGRNTLSVASEARDTYLNALRHADRTLDYDPLVTFARS